MKYLFATLCFVCCVLLPGSDLLAEEPADIEVVALFSNSALLRINGKQVLLKEGKAATDGIQLIEADSKGVVLEIDGKRTEMQLSQRISSRFQAPEFATVSVQINNKGQYITTGSINGRPVRLLIDTGANIVAMNATMAKSLGIDVSGARPMITSTAGGTVISREVFLDSVQVGQIKVANVQAAVLEGNFPVDILIGMSFLNQVKIEKEAGLMVLTSQY